MKKVVYLLLLAIPVWAVTHQDLQAKIDSLNAKTKALEQVNGSLIVDTAGLVQKIEKLAFGNVPIMVAGISTTTATSTMAYPIGFAAGSSGVSALQLDLAFPPGVIVGAATPGSAALAAGKQVLVNPVTGGTRFLMFGLNQTSIPTGVLATVQLSIPAGMKPNLYHIAASNQVASDGAGNAVPSSVVDGVLLVIR